MFSPKTNRVMNLFSTPIQAPATRLNEQTKVYAALRTEVVLGSPGARCNGVGICRVMGRQQQDTDCPCPKVWATLQVTESGSLRFVFEKAGMDRAYKQQHFEWLLFTVTEPYRLSPRLRRDLGWKGQWIQPGVYHAWETPDAFIVDFTA